MLNFKWGQRCGGVFKSNSPLKTNSHCPVSVYLSRVAYGARGQGLRWHWEQGDKGSPSSLEVTAPELVLQGAATGTGAQWGNLFAKVKTWVPQHLAVNRRFLHQMDSANSPSAKLSQTPETKPWSCLSGSLPTASCGVTAQGVLQGHTWERGQPLLSQPHFLYHNTGASAGDCWNAELGGNHYFCGNKRKRMNFIVKWKETKNFRTRNT